MQYLLVGRWVLTQQVFNLSTPRCFDKPRKLSTWTWKKSFLPWVWWKTFVYRHHRSHSGGIKGCFIVSLSLLPGKTHIGYGVRNLLIAFLPPTTARTGGNPWSKASPCIPLPAPARMPLTKQQSHSKGVAVLLRYTPNHGFRHSARLLSSNTDAKGDALKKAQLVLSGASVPVRHQPCCL